MTLYPFLKPQMQSQQKNRKQRNLEKEVVDYFMKILLHFIFV